MNLFSDGWGKFLRIFNIISVYQDGGDVMTGPSLM